MRRRDALGMGLGALYANTIIPAAQAAGKKRQPNFIVILCDDLGYGEFGYNDGGYRRSDRDYYGDRDRG